MTNEEWFCDLSAENKAEVIVRLAVNYGSNLDNKFLYDCAYKWLKEKHKDANT